MAVPSINSENRFAWEWRMDDRGMTKFAYLSLRWRHVLEDFERAEAAYNALSRESRKQQPGLFQSLFFAERLYGDQRRQILGQIPFVGEFYLMDRELFGGMF